MNTQKIKFVGNAQHTIEIQNCYPYLISQQTGKVVLRIAANEADTLFDDLHDLKNNSTGIIEYYERTVDIDPETGEEVAGDWELKNTYKDYDSGEVAISYQNGIYNAEVTRVSGEIKAMTQLRADVDFIAAMEDIPLD